MALLMPKKLTRFERFIAAGERARARKHANSTPMLPTGGGVEMTRDDLLGISCVFTLIISILLVLVSIGIINVG